ncbi:hypothetical protein [Mesorhizobium sp. Pch-S]|uniref:hypothetical protein n=1 Tax=Mesorhizobium sp. Pch-S TaxID=2082387 RepID=UPI0010124166|nr:hypothetical protein [Mesorhizobium sp. Pch-S]QAZ45933.1 hypothetical protein C1M53_26470 [Mesorhizobium sp. Pch-S]
MGDRRFIFWFNVIVGPLVGGFAAYWIASSVLGEYSWCIAGEEHCVREWVSALSGWAAAVAAGVTLFALYDQLREQRRQTDFVLGDAKPTLTARHPQDRLEDFALRIVNWNRVSADILRVRVAWSNVPVQVGLKEVGLGDRTVGINMDPNISGIVRIDGWENRSDAPPFGEIFGYVSAVDRSVADEEISVVFAVDLFMPTEMPRVVTLEAKLNMAPAAV